MGYVQKKSSPEGTGTVPAVIKLLLPGDRFSHILLQWVTTKYCFMGYRQDSEQTAALNIADTEAFPKLFAEPFHLLELKLTIYSVDILQRIYIFRKLLFLQN